MYEDNDYDNDIQVKPASGFRRWLRNKLVNFLDLRAIPGPPGAMGMMGPPGASSQHILSYGDVPNTAQIVSDTSLSSTEHKKLTMLRITNAEIREIRVTGRSEETGALQVSITAVDYSPSLNLEFSLTLIPSTA